MKRYLLFAGEDYYPVGGWDDFIGSFDSLGEALARVTEEYAHSKYKTGFDWAHCIDRESSIDDKNLKRLEAFSDKPGIYYWK